MSKETLSWLNNNVLVGNTMARGNAWHYKASEQGAEPNHYDYEIPVADVLRRLFSFQAIEAPVDVVTPNGAQRSTKRKAIIASDDFSELGIVGIGYAIHQYNEWLLDNVATILDGDLSISAAGLLTGRSKAWVEVSIPDTISTPEGVTFRPNLLAATSLDGSLATQYRRTITNTVCDNTLDIALGEAGQFIKFRHSSGSLSRIGEARDALGIIYTAADDFAEEVKQFCNTTVTDDQWASILEALHPTKNVAPGRSLTVAQNKQVAIDSLWRSDERVTPWKNTAWGVVQAANTYATHEASFKGGNRVERNMVAELNGNRSKADAGVLKALQLVLA
jgi:phage/plasmid-like protein (TIGR03299 family)